MGLLKIHNTMILDLRETAALLLTDKGNLIIDALHRADDMIGFHIEIEVNEWVTNVKAGDWTFRFRHWEDSYCGVVGRHPEKQTVILALAIGWVELL
jgi:hypothetical protein